jgi:hypothetical protein
MPATKTPTIKRGTSTAQVELSVASTLKPFTPKKYYKTTRKMKGKRKKNFNSNL